MDCTKSIAYESMARKLTDHLVSTITFTCQVHFVLDFAKLLNDLNQKLVKIE